MEEKNNDKSLKKFHRCELGTMKFSDNGSCRSLTLEESQKKIRKITEDTLSLLSSIDSDAENQELEEESELKL